MLSLKGDSPVWRGMSDTTGVAPPGTFEVLEGVVVSRDGTDLMPDLGAQLSGKPFYGQAFPSQRSWLAWASRQSR